MKKQPISTASPKNFSVIAPDNGREAQILIYGVIGVDWWEDDEAQNTDENLALALASLGERYDTIHVRLNSPGGDVMHGLAIINAMKRCKAKVVTWNDGLAASMASGIWMAGTERHMAKNALLMVHSPINWCWGNAADMREAADLLDTWEKGLVNQMAETCGMSEQDVKAQYFDGKDHWLGFEDCVALGLMPQPEKPEEDYQAAATVQNVQGRNIEELFALYRAKPADQKPARTNMLARIRAMFGLEDATAPQADDDTHIHSPSIIELDMTKEELTAALGDALAAHEAAKAAAAPAPAAQAGEDDPIAKMEARIAAAEAKNAALEAKLGEVGAQPGEKPAAATLPPDAPDANDGHQSVKSFHAELVANWNNGVPNRIAD